MAVFLILGVGGLLTRNPDAPISSRLPGRVFLSSFASAHATTQLVGKSVWVAAAVIITPSPSSFFCSSSPPPSSSVSFGRVVVIVRHLILLTISKRRPRTGKSALQPVERRSGATFMGRKVYLMSQGMIMRVRINRFPYRVVPVAIKHVWKFTYSAWGFVCCTSMRSKIVASCYFDLGEAWRKVACFRTCLLKQALHRRSHVSACGPFRLLAEGARIFQVIC